MQLLFLDKSFEEVNRFSKLIFFDLSVFWLFLLFIAKVFTKV